MIRCTGKANCSTSRPVRFTSVPLLVSPAKRGWYCIGCGGSPMLKRVSPTTPTITLGCFRSVTRRCLPMASSAGEELFGKGIADDHFINLSSEAEHIGNDLAKVMPDIEQLAQEFTGRIVEWFRQKCIRLDEPVTRSLLVGFAKNLPVCWEIQICSEPCYCARPIDETYTAFSGPQSVFEDLNRNGRLREPNTLEKGKEGISCYLASCIEREPFKYGGQTHIAVIPRTRRVEWMIPPASPD
jgi:hypothetical protein